jgi:60 kDa SS-A/Ro ribonucleoprotein
MYARGAGYRGDGSWTPVRQVIDVLDQAFYKAFDYVEPTGQNLVVAIDGSGSMEHEISGSPLSCREAAIAIGMVHALTEKWSVVLGFTMGSNVCEIPVSKGQRLDDVIRTFNRMVKPERTDCALPYRWAYDKKAEVDGFVLLTDNETWSGSAHPYQYLNEYRRRMGRNTKTAVVGMTATNCTVGDTGDPGTLNVVGFDPTVPQVVSNFLRGS